MSLHICPMSWYIDVAKRPHLQMNLVTHHEWSVLHSVYQTSLPYCCIQLEHKNLLLCVFWIFLLASHAILGSWCEEFFWTLSKYSITLSMAMISKESDPVSRRRVYVICFVTCRNTLYWRLVIVLKYKRKVICSVVSMWWCGHHL